MRVTGSKNWILLLAAVLLLTASRCSPSPTVGDVRAPENAVPQAVSPALEIKVVPERYRTVGSTISMGKENRDSFFVIITNVSDTPQYLWEDWNSWGYYCLSFEIKTQDGIGHKLKRRDTVLTRNFPSSMLVPAGELIIIPVTLDEAW